MTAESQFVKNKIFLLHQFSKLNPSTHCDHRGLPSALLVIRGELSGQYICRACYDGFDRDIPSIDKPEAFTTEARFQADSLSASAGLPAIPWRNL